MDRRFCSSVPQQVAANNLCLNFHHLHLVIVPYLTSYEIVISPLVSLMSAKFEIIGIKSRLRTSHLLSGGGGGWRGGGGGGGAVRGRVHFYLRNQNFMSLFIFSNHSPLPHTHSPDVTKNL